MNVKAQRVMQSVFGKVKQIERIRTNILFVKPYGSITVPDVELGMGLGLYVARVPDAEFYEGAYWASYGPKPCDENPDLFVVPVFVKPYAQTLCDNWAIVTSGSFLTTTSGVIVLDADGVFAWEGYNRPNKRDYNYDRRRLEKSAAALKALAGTP